jgi:hypothetical protein
MAIPPPPPGFTLDQPQAAIPPPPPGFTLDTQAPPASRPSLAMAPVGGAELLGQLATGAVASIPAGLAYGGAAVGKAFGADVDPSAVQRDVQSYLTYRPRSDSARAGADLALRTARPVVEPIVRKYGEATEYVGERSPFAGELMKAAPGALQAASAVVPPIAGGMAAARRPFVPAAAAAARSTPFKSTLPTTAEEVLARQTAGSAQNMGAAAAAPRLQNVSPELRQAIVNTARRSGGVVNPEVLARHVDADSLPVRVRLTEGQATGDVQLLSAEQNMRGRTPQFAERFNEQNRALAQNMQAIRDEAGPDVFSANVVEHGDTLINAYRTVDAAREAQVTQAYQALRQGAGGQFPVGARTLLGNATQELHRRLLFDHAPPTVMKTLERLAANPGSMTFENFESLRTNLARIQRSSVDGNERAAAGVIRNAMEDLPLVPGAARLKPLADRARALHRERREAIEADPAYEAAVNETVPPDRFVQRFVIGGTRDNLARMRSTIGADESAAQTMGVAALDYLRDQARLSPTYEGNFATASYSKALNRLSPSLRSLLQARQVEQLEQLGRVAGYTTFQPRGSFVNNSNTFTAAAAEGAKGAAEGAANVAAGGIPIGTWARRGLEGRSTRRQAERATAPGAGLDHPQGRQ